jgi:hypothetical protein
LNLLLYLGFEPKKNLKKKKKTLNENERNTKLFWLLVKKTQIFDPVQFSKYRMVWVFSIAGLIVILVFYQTGAEFHLVCRSNPLQQYGYLVTEFSDETHFVTHMSSFGDAIHLLSHIGLSW